MNTFKFYKNRFGLYSFSAYEIDDSQEIIKWCLENFGEKNEDRWNYYIEYKCIYIYFKSEIDVCIFKLAFNTYDL